MAVTLPNSGIVIPDEGNHTWYTMFVSLMTLLDTISAADDYIVPASGQHIQASMAALFNDIYGRTFVLETTTPYEMVIGGDTVVIGGDTVIVRR